MVWGVIFKLHISLNLSDFQYKMTSMKPWYSHFKILKFNHDVDVLLQYAQVVEIKAHFGTLGISQKSCRNFT